MTPQHRRASDPPVGHGWRFWRNGWRWWVWYGERVWQDVIPLFALGIALFAVLHLNHESAQRRDQNCIVFERDAIAAKTAYVTAKEQLDNTERYLANLPAAERKTTINVAVAANLPRLEETVDLQWRNAKASAAPPYCDQPGVGLDEPNPALPSKPR